MSSWLIYIYVYECLHYFWNNMRNNKHRASDLQVKKKLIIFYEVFKNYLIYIRNNISLK